MPSTFSRPSQPQGGSSRGGIPRGLTANAVWLIPHWAVLVAAGLCGGEVPETSARTIVVNGQHAAADDQHAGTESQPLKTINRAAQLAQPGDTVLVHAGTYRERVSPASGGSEGQPIVYSAVSGEVVVIKGSEVWRPSWQRLDVEKPIFRGQLDPAMFVGERVNPYRTPLKAAPDGQQLTLGQVFVDGQGLREVVSAAALESTSATWMVEDHGAAITIHFPHTGVPLPERLVELTVRDRIFAPRRRGLGYIHVKGFTMEHCANQFPDRFWESDSPQAGALGCRAGHHWLIEGNTIRFAKSIGLDCGYEGRHDLEGSQPTPRNTGQHLIRNNSVTDNGCCGIAGMRSLRTRIMHNVVERNNLIRHTASEAAGIKVHYFIDGQIAGNLVRHNDAHGIWIDNVYRHARVTRNLVVSNRGVGIFVELGEGPILVDNNVVASTRPSFLQKDPRGDGIYSHDASGITLAHNLIFDSHRFGSCHLKATNRPRAGADRIQLLNNIFINNQAGNINLPWPGPNARANRSDSNLVSPDANYLLNPSGGNAQQVLMNAVEQAIGRRPALWDATAPRLSWREWRQATAWDRQSVEAGPTSVRISDDLELTIDLGRAARNVTTTPVPGLDLDFSGNPVPAHGALVGPFQQLTDDKNVIRLW